MGVEADHPLKDAGCGELWRVTGPDGRWAEWRILEGEEEADAVELGYETPVAAFVAAGGRIDYARREPPEPLYLVESVATLIEADDSWQRRDSWTIMVGDEVTTEQRPYDRIRWVVVAEGDRDTHDRIYVDHHGPGFWCRPAEGQDLNRRDLLAERGPRYFAAPELRRA